MIYLGIDPGVTGAVGAAGDGGSAVRDIPASVVSKGTVKQEINGALLAELLRRLTLGRPATAVLERTAARPAMVHGKIRQGSASTFSMGVSRGVCLGVLGALGIPYVEVLPQVWKAHYKLIGKDKDASRTLAISLFPALAGELARKKDHNRAEALLLAKYAQTLDLSSLL